MLALTLSVYTFVLSTMLGIYNLPKWRHLYSTQQLCVQSWMDWFQVYNRYMQRNLPSILQILIIANCTFKNYIFGGWNVTVQNRVNNEWW